MSDNPSLIRNPQLDQWLRFDPDQRITVYTGKVELGQQLASALKRVAAEELDVAPDRIRLAPVSTGASPNEMFTAGSGSMEQSAAAIRASCAQARHLLLARAATRLQTTTDQLSVDDGEIRAADSNRWTSYWELMAGQRFGCAVSTGYPPKPPAAYRLVGRAGIAIGDIEPLIDGTAVYVHDLCWPDMVHARVVRPPGYHAELTAVDTGPAAAVAGVLKVIRDGRFLAIVAEREEQALAGAEQLSRSARWHYRQTLPTGSVYTRLRNNRRTSLAVIDGIPDPDHAISDTSPPATSARSLNSSFYRPYQMHAAIGPAAAAACYRDRKLTLWTHSQGIYPLRASLAAVLVLDERQIVIHHVPGAGCYGHNGADDAALDAALIARQYPGRPVLLKWTRADEHRWEPYSPAMIVDVQASLDVSGRIVHWSQETYSDTHINRPRPGGRSGSQLLAAWHLATPLPPPPAQPNLAFHGGIHRNADPVYDLPHRRIVKHLVHDLPLRTSAMRGLGAFANVFAIESMMDELARAAGTDPLEFRLAHLSDERGRTVLTTLAEACDWENNKHLGLAFARYKNTKCYAAVAVELSVDERGQIQLQHVTIVADAGQVIDPEGLCCQLEGGVIQSASLTLKEAVSYNHERITSDDWASYPLLKFTEVPTFTTRLIERPGYPYLGSGEATHGPTPAAIANGVYAVSGVRLREIPFTPERVLTTAISG